MCCKFAVQSKDSRSKTWWVLISMKTPSELKTVWIDFYITEVPIVNAWKVFLQHISFLRKKKVYWTFCFNFKLISVLLFSWMCRAGGFEAETHLSDAIVRLRMSLDRCWFIWKKCWVAAGRTSGQQQKTGVLNSPLCCIEISCSCFDNLAQEPIPDWLHHQIRLFLYTGKTFCTSQYWNWAEAICCAVMMWYWRRV